MLLSKIAGPGDLTGLTAQEIEVLAAEIRDLIIRTVAQNGGHLAASLGAVELTLALHRVFKSPRDRIIWDVGHQSYAHKIITGRREEFGSLRLRGGLSGFPKRQESVHDAFDTGHSSTSISAALGIALARDYLRQSSHVVAVIGDGALTGGMAFEALNHAGHTGTRLIVVLNDNEMSIAGNVGALARYLSRIRTDPKYFKGKEDIELVLRRLPAIGDRVVRLVERLKDSLKYLVVPGMFFEELGFTYLGPIDGHSFVSLMEVLERARGTPGPVLVHVLTRKGHGYPPAEADPNRFHGIGPFEVATGEVITSGAAPTYTDVFGEQLLRLAAEDERIIGITAAMPDGTGLAKLQQRYPSRVLDVGIAEQHAVTLAAGLACSGLKPVVAIYSTFLQRAYDQVLHDVCLQNLPVVFALDRAGIVGEDGETHQGLFDLAYLRPIPNMAIMAPKDEGELAAMLLTALEYQGPVALRYPRGSGVGVPLDGAMQALPIGRAELLRDGTDLTILALGPLAYAALDAAADLAGSGIEAAVVNARFVKPLDRDLILDLASRTCRLVTVEEHVLAGGFGSAVLELLADSGLVGVSLTRIGLPDSFVSHGKPDALRAIYGLDAAGIARTVFGLVQGKAGFKMKRVRGGR